MRAPALKEEIVQQVEDQVAGGEDVVIAPGRSYTISWQGSATPMKKLPVFRASRIAAKGAGRHVIGCRVQVGSPRHQFDAVGQQLDMAELLRRDGGDQAVERLQLALVEEVEALEEVVIQRGHLA